MTDPLTDIENRQANIDFGRTAARFYQGTRQEGANRREAFWITLASLTAIMHAPPEPEETDD
jgi:hypothetical protein